MKVIQRNPHIIELSHCILNLCVMNLSLILFNTSSGIYSIPKESKCTAVFLSTNNETLCFPLLFCHWDLSHTLHLLFYVNCLLKNTIKPRLLIEIVSNPNIA